MPNHSDKKIYGGLLILYLAILMLFTLAPFRLQFPVPLHHLPWPVGPLHFELDDFIRNIILFLPFGFLLYTLLPYRRFILTIILSAGISLTIEILQMIIRARFSSPTDIFSNALGGGIGFLIGHQFRKQNLLLMLSLYRQKIALVLLFMVLALLSFLALLAWKPFPMGSKNTTLLIGDNPERNSQWKGDLLSLEIDHQAWQADQIKQHYLEGIPTKEKRISEPIGMTGQFTIGTWIRIKDQLAMGGRIVSLFEGNYSLFYLHQNIDDIVFCVRISALKKGRLHWEGIETALALLQKEPVYLVAVYDKDKMTLYVNGELVAEDYMTDGFFILADFLNLDRMPWGGRAILGFILFWPLGFLLSLMRKGSLTFPVMFGFVFMGLIFLIQAQHPPSFFNQWTCGVSMLAMLLGTVSGLGLRKSLDDLQDNV